MNSNWLIARGGGLYNIAELSVLAEQPEKGSWLFMGSRRISLADAAESLSEQLDSEWVSIPCKVSRRGTHHGQDFKIWVRPEEIVSVVPHSSVKVSLVTHRDTGGRVFFSPLSTESLASILDGNQTVFTWDDHLEVPIEDELTGITAL